MASIEVRSIAREELDELYPQLAALTGADDRALTLAEYDWFFFRNPAGAGVCGGAFEGDRLVGVTSIAPKRMRVGGKSVKAGEVSRATTEPALRGRGLFSKLVGFLTEQARERDYGFLYATPNANSGPIFLGRLGFEPMFHWDRSARALAWGEHPTMPGPARPLARVLQPAWDVVFPLRRGGTVCTVDDHALAAVGQLANPDGGRCVVDRTEAYLSWRYERPGRTYRHVHCRTEDGTLVGWAAASFVEEGLRRRLHVGDWWTAPQRNALPGLLAGTRELARESGATELYVAGRRPTSPKPDRRRGFVTRPSQRPVIGLSLHLDVGALQNWDYREADADMF